MKKMTGGIARFSRPKNSSGDASELKNSSIENDGTHQSDSSIDFQISDDTNLASWDDRSFLDANVQNDEFSTFLTNDDNIIGDINFDTMGDKVVFTNEAETNENNDKVSSGVPTHEKTTVRISDVSL